MTPEQLVATRKQERRLTILTAFALVVAVISFGLAACGSLANSSDSGSSGPATTSSGTGSGSSSTRGHGGSPGAADGVLPNSTSPFDTSLPGTSKLNPDLLRAVQQASEAAKKNGITLTVTTGWRSKAYQKELLQKAIRKYGSEEKARKYVSSPEESHHVTGNAVDIGPTDADDWLIRRGARFGLCQTLANEMWHFELATTPGGTCPPMAGAADG
ncbi:MAG TPA: M15 family metallopeptidase [Kribbella sp.]